MQPNELSYRNRSREDVIAHFTEATYPSSMPAMIGEHRIIVAANPAFARMMGASNPEEVVGLSADVFYPDSQPDGHNSTQHRQQLREKIRAIGFHRYTIFLKSLNDCPILTEVNSHFLEYVGGSFMHHSYSILHEPDDVAFGDRTTEEVFREIVRKSKTKIMLIVDGTLIEMSKPLLTLVGRDSHDAQQDYEAGMFSPEFQPDGRRSDEAIMNELKTAVLQGDIRVPWSLLDADRNERQVEVHATSFLLGGKQAFQLTFYDYSEDKKERKAAERMLAALDATTDGLMLIDLDNTKIDECNRVAHEMLGYSKRELLQMRVPDIVPQEYFERNRENLVTLKEGESLPAFDSAHIAKSGEWIPVSISARTIVIEGKRLALGSIRDKRSELKLQNATEDLRRQFEMVGELLPVGVFIQSLNHGNIYVNRAWTRITGMSQDDAAGLGWQKVFPAIERESMVEEGLKELVEKGASKGRYQVTRPDGKQTWVEHQSALLPLSDGTSIIIGTLQDVTETEQRQRDLEEARAIAEDASDAKSSFLSHMSHELRTPLNAVIGFTQVLQSEQLTDSQQECLGHIEIGGALLLKHVEDLLDLSRIEQRQLKLVIEEYSAAPLIQGVVQLVQQFADDSAVTLNSNDMDDSVVIRVDEHRFKQVILNLLSNAIKYNQSGGRVDLRLDTHDGQARLEVRDTGHGIPADQLKNLFKPFDRLGAENTSVEGLGIGLTLSQELVNNMDGTISTQSEEGVGTTMTVLVPLA